MGKFIKESNFLNDNVFAFEERLNSQYTRILDMKATYTTYFHINTENSTTDVGFENIERTIGENSPLKFNEIKEFPLYGIEQMAFNLSQQDEGLTVEYDSEAVILPNTVEPYPNDYFLITYINKPYLFRITSVVLDNIKSNNYYKVGFTLESTNEEAIEALYKQCIGKFTCDINNLGTEYKCIIEDDTYLVVEKIDSIISSLLADYKIVYYKEKYNSFVLLSNEDEKEPYFIYDRCLNNFITQHNLYNDKYSPDTILLSNEDDTDDFIFEYNNSFFKRIEEESQKKIKDSYGYMLAFLTNYRSIFTYYGVSTKTVRQIFSANEYIPNDLLENIKENKLSDTPIYNIIVKYFNNEYKSINTIDLDELGNISIEYSFFDYIFIPMIIYIIHKVSHRFLKISSIETSR